jgi:hypothetical protein
VLVGVYGNEVLLGDFGSLGNGGGNVCTLGDTDTNAILTVTHNNEGAETEPAATLYYAGYAVNVQDALVELLLFGSKFGAATVTTGAARTAWTATLAATATAVTLVATLALRSLALAGTLGLLVLLSCLCFGCCSWGCSFVFSHG